jgi:hypothetical protein
MLKYLVFTVLISITYCAISQNIVPASMSIVDNTRESSIDQVWFTPEGTVGTVGKFHKVEIGFKLEKDIEREVENFITKRAKGINPFDPEQVDVSVKLIAPNGEEIITHGFYYLPYFKNRLKDLWIADTTSFKWRMRFAPDQIGAWKGEVDVRVKGFASAKSSFKFNCIESGHKGVLKTSKTGTLADRYLYESESGKTFIPIGHNITTRGKDVSLFRNELHKKWITELSDNGGNFFRMELPPGGALPDWPTWPYDSTSYKSCYDYSDKLDKMYGFDEIFELAELKEMYFIMMRHHVEVMHGSSWDSWTSNPYKSAFNLTSSEEYFKNPEILKLQQNTLQYIMARWGYSPSFAFYSYQEIDIWTTQIGLEAKESFNLIADWLVTMKEHVRGNSHFLSDMYTFPFTSNFASSKLTKKSKSGAQRVLAESDVIGLHAYHNEKAQNYKSRYNYVDDLLKGWKGSKPVILDEVGLQMPDIYCCTDVDFHNTVWSTSLMGGMGMGLHWNWDRGIHDKQYYLMYNHVNAFYKNENLREGKYQQQRWKNDNSSSMKNATIENYALKSNDKTRVLGWVHNATFYWRNMGELKPCVQELLDSGKIKNPCELQDKSPALGSRVISFYNYNNPNFEDAYSNTDKAKEVLDAPIFKIKGLKRNFNRLYNPWAKKHFYRISFYNTHGALDTIAISSAVISTNSSGILKPTVPELTKQNPDYSYKIEYIGLKKRERAKL